jgi:hypothetical protein
LVSDPDRGVEVTASAPDEHGLLLERHAPIVLGRALDQLVTLTEVQLGMSKKIPGGTAITMRPWRTFIGVEFEPEEEIAFDRFVLRVEALNEWASRSGFPPDTLPLNRNRFTIEYATPEPIDVAQVDNIRVRVRFGSWGRTRGTPLVSVEVGQEAEFEFVADGPMPYDVLEPLARHIRNFVMFAARQRVDVVSTRGYIKPEVGERSLRDHKVDIVSRTYGLPDRDQPKLDEHGLLFRLDHNGDPPESRLDRWLTLQHEDELGPVFNLYLAGLYQPKLFIEFQFLALAQAAESLHSRRLRRQPYGTAIVGLVKRLPPGVKAVLPERQVFARKVEATRNYHTHWNLDDRAEAATTMEELNGLTAALRCVLEALLLLELGFTHEEVDQLLERHLNFKRELRWGLESCGLVPE